GPVYLDSLTSLPEGIKFENHGPVYLDSLTSLPEGIKFENHGPVYLGSLTGKHTYLGVEREFRCVDGCTMLICGSKQYGGHTVYSARYFGGGEIKGLNRCYIAESDGITAHGNTMKSAVDDLAYKIADSAHKAEVAKSVKASGVVTLADFRALTGACRDGIRQHLSGLGIDLDQIDSMPLSDALKAMDGTSYGETFKRHIQEAEAA
ncbi:hypothetical protein PXK01_19410, partial [Phaeobacter sp. PT47_59]|uniref:hypothetical protein n=1 Tax=Phaeobacter sp. PT47_59 TaxID=3029979 RepID=UPI00237FF0A9